MILLKDMQELFDFVEPADENLNCYSYRMHELLIRASIEVEANCKAILVENGYARSGNMTMTDYKKINASHHLSCYKVKMPFWNGMQGTRTPYSAWARNAALPWYDSYNATKHDRHNSFQRATLEHMIDAMGGLVIVLSSQFNDHSFGAANSYLGPKGSPDGMTSSIGDYFRIRYPDDWAMDERYDFVWQLLGNDPDPIQQFPYPAS
jgi:hypothetical protein